MAILLESDDPLEGDVVVSTFGKPVNKPTSPLTIARTHAPGSPTLVLSAGAGDVLGVLGPNQVYRVSVLLNYGQPYESCAAIVEATTLDPDGVTLGGLTFVEGYDDTTLGAGLVVAVRLTAKGIAEVQSALNAVEVAVASAGATVAAGLATHIADHSNPHAVTKLQVGLGNADDTSDAAKPISNATATALAIHSGQIGNLQANAAADETAIGLRALDSATVHRTGDETIGGAKTFTTAIVGSVTGNSGSVTNGVVTTGTYADPVWIASLSGSKITGNIAGDASSLTGSIAESQVVGLSTDLTTLTTAVGLRSLDANTLHLTGAETVAGTKTFSSTILGSISGNAGTVTNGVVTTGSYADPAWIASLAGSRIVGDIPGNAASLTGSIAEAQVTGLVSALATLTTAVGLRALDSATVHTSGAETIGGTKTFSATIAGSITGNAGTVTNGVVTTVGYTDPAWIASLAGSKITGNIPGNAASLTGSIAEAQVTGLVAALATLTTAVGARALDAATVHTAGDETIAGVKTFTSTIAGSIAGNAATATNGVVTTGTYADPAWITGLGGSKVTGNIPGNAASLTGSIAESQVTNLTTDLGNLSTAIGLRALDSATVHTTGAETIGGVKTFTATIAGSISGNAGTVTNGVVTTGAYADPSWVASLAGAKIVGNIPGNAASLTGSIAEGQVSGLTTDLGTLTTAVGLRALDSAAVHRSGDETVGGTKTFTSTIAGSVTGNAGTVTGGVVTTGSYADPTWLTSLAGSKVVGDIAGNAASITGTIAEAQVSGLLAALASRQPLDGTLTALAGLTIAADELIYASGVDTFAVAPLSGFGRSLVAVADAATARVTLVLDHVDNTADTDKPVSTATAAALAGKAPLASPTFTGTPVAPTPTAGTNTVQIATTAFVHTAVATTDTGAVHLTGDETVAGVKAFTSTIVGSISGNAATVTNGIVTTGSYADPAWITSVAASKVAGDIAGNAASITGTVTESQVTGLVAALGGKQPIDPTLTALAGVSTVADTVIYATGGDTFAVTSLTAFGRSLLADPDATAGRLTLSLDHVDNTSDATKNSAPVTLTNKTLDPTNAITVRDANLTIQDDADPTRQARFQAAGIAAGTTRTLTLPDASTTLVGTDAPQVLTNKTLTSPAITTPTGLVRADVGLGNVDNTSDASKPISTATANALATKAPLASPAFTGTPTAPTASIGTSTTQIATTAFVLGAVGSTDANVVHLTGAETVAGTKTFSSTIIGSITGNAGTVTNGLVNTGSYADPAWITSLASSKVVGDIAGNAASITGVITESQVTGLVAGLASKAPIDSPAFTGIPVAPTATGATNTTQIATTAFVLGEIASLVDSAPSVLNTLGEIAAALQADESGSAALTAAVAGKQPLDATLTALAGVTTATDTVIYATGADSFAVTTLTAFGRSMIANADAPTARGMLGLGSIATRPAPTGVVVGDTDVQTLSGKTLTAPVINAPTGLTKADVGLGSVDNTADAAKPVSTATATALAAKAPLASPALTGTPTAPTASTGTATTQLATTAFVHSAVVATDSTAVHTTGDESIDGVKTFLIPIAGSITGNAATATHGVVTTGSYADPAWITSITGAKVSGDIAGNASSITGSIAESQVTGLVPALAGKHPLSAKLAAIDALSWVTNKIVYLTGSATAALLDLSAYMGGLLGSADAPTARTALGLGSIATRSAPAGTVVGDTDTQTLTGKTLTAPVITAPTGIVKGDVGLTNVDNTSDATKNAAAATLGNKTLDVSNAATLKDTLFTLQDDGDATKQARFQASGISTATTRTYTLPDATTTLVGTDAVQTLTAKTLTAPVISSPTGLVKADIGLGSVDNTSDAGKPISTATQTALDLKASLASPMLTGTPTAPTAAGGTNTTQVASTAFVHGVVATVDANAVHLTGDETVAGIKTFLSPIVGSISGNAGTATNGVVTTGSYTDPAWITSIAGAKVTGNIPGNAVSLTGSIAEAQVTGLVAGLAGKQPLDGTLTALSGVATAADELIYATGVDTFATTVLTTFGRSLLADVDAPAARTTLGLGTAATLASSAVALTANNLSDLASASTARANLGLGTIATHAAPAGVVVGDTDTQTLTNKTLTAPAISAPTGLVKGDVGLGSVDNTADADKPISTAMATALAGKQATGSYLTALTGDVTASGPGSAAATIGAGKVTNAMLAGPVPASKLVGTDLVIAESQVTGLTTDLAGKQSIDATLTALAGVTTAADELIYATGVDAFAATALTAFGRSLIDDADAAAARVTVGLGNVDDTSDAGKPVSNATATALGLKANTADLGSAAFQPTSAFDAAGSAAAITKASIGLGSVENTALSTWHGSTVLDTIGTVTAGTWHGTPIADAYIASSATWNAKQPAGAYLTALTGDVAAAGPGSAASAIGAGKVTNAMLAGSIAAGKLVGTDIVVAESQVTNLTTDLGNLTTAVGLRALDSAVVHNTGAETVAGIKTFSSIIAGSISGNAATATNGVVTTGTYADPAWVTSLAGSKVTGDIPGNAASLTGSIAESQVTGLATDLAGKAPTVHTHDAADVVSGTFAPARLATGTPAAGKYPDGTGAWTAPPGSPPGGSSGQIQYNNGSGGFGGSTKLAFDGTKLLVGGPTQSVAPPTGADFIGYSIVSDAGNLCLAFRTKVDPSAGYSKVSFCDPTNGIEYGSMGFRSLDPNLFIGSGLSVQGLVTALGGLQVYNGSALTLSGVLTTFAGFDIKIFPQPGQSTIIYTPTAVPALTVGPDGVVSAGDASGLTVYQQINNQSGTAYTLALTDKSKCLAFSSATAVTLTIPPHSSVAFPIGVEIGLIQLGTGQVTIAAGAGVTLLAFSGEVMTAGQNAYAVVKQVATDQWVPMGRLA